MNRLSVLVILLCFLSTSLFGQLTLPKGSQYCEISQTIGISQIKVQYHRPKVQDRNIWGELVPFHKNAELAEGKIPWRAGANENTIVSFSHEAMIEGKKIPAGSYGLHMIPSENEWVAIFSKNYSSWGSYFYKPEEDVLRVRVKPVEHAHHELLTFDFLNQTANSATLALMWDKLMVPINVELDVQEITLASMRDELRSTPGFTWQGWNTAAQYCINQDINHEEALQWADQALRRGKNFTTLQTKATLLTMTGKETEAETLMATALETASKNELNQYGYQLMNQGKMDQAIAAFEQNVKNHPDDPNLYDSLGEGLANRNADGDKKRAIKLLKKSLSMDPPANVRANSIKTLKKLGVETESYESARANR